MSKQPSRVGGVGAGIGALRNQIARVGVRLPDGSEPTDAMVFAAAGGIGFHYVFLDRGASPRILVDGLARGFSTGPDLVTESVGAFGVRAQVSNHKTELEAENALVDTLERGSPVLAWVDRAQLPYDRMPRGYARTMPHLLGVNSFSERHEEFQLDDRAAHPLPLDAARFRVSWGQAGGGGYRMAVLQRAGSPADIPARILASLCAGLEMHRSSRIGNRGLLGMRTVASRLRSASHAQSWSRAFSRGAASFHAHASLYRCLEHTAGAGASRGLVAEALSSLGAALGRDDVVALAGSWTRIAQRWSNFAEHTLPDSIPALGEARLLIRARDQHFLSEGLDAVALIAATSARLAQIARETEESMGAGLDSVRLQLADELDALMVTEAGAIERTLKVCERQA